MEEGELRLLCLFIYQSSLDSLEDTGQLMLWGDVHRQSLRPRLGPDLGLALTRISPNQGRRTSASFFYVDMIQCILPWILLQTDGTYSLYACSWTLMDIDERLYVLVSMLSFNPFAI